MVKLLSTRIHGIIDYVMGITLLVLPWLFGWNAAVTTLLTVLGLGIIVYSLFTRYEVGVFRLLPMAFHLGLDAIGGVVLIAAAFFITTPGTGSMAVLLILGLLELGAAAVTDPVSTLDREHQYVRG